MSVSFTDFLRSYEARVAPLLMDLVAARNSAARSLGFPDFYRMRLALDQLDEAEVFRVGARFHWNEMLRRATGERLSAEHFAAEFIGDGSSQKA